MNGVQSITSVQNGRGRTASVDAWVFGMVDTSCSPLLGFMEVVPDRTANTLLPIIQQHVAPGTEIWSDQWRAYTQVVHLIISKHVYTCTKLGSTSAVDPRRLWASG